MPGLIWVAVRSPESGSRQIVQSLTAGPPLAKSTRPPWCAVHASGILVILDSRRSSSGVAPLAAFRYKLKMLPPRSEANTIDVPSGDQIGTMLCDRSNVNREKLLRLLSHNQRLQPGDAS